MTDTGDDPWTELLEDADSLAENYREAGWDAVAVSPTDVVAVDRGDRAGLEALVTESVYDPVESLVKRDGAAFDRAEVYRREVDDETHVLLAEADDETETTVVVPLAYTLEDARDVLEAALEAGILQISVRPPSLEDGWVSVLHDEPSLFVDESRL